MATKRIRGINTGYEDAGEGHPLVLVHGHPFNRSMWRDQVAEFGRRRRVVAPDLRGFGESEAVEDKTTLEEFALDIAALLDELGLDDVALCGLSMGGQIALEFYRLFPRRARALMLADTFAQLWRVTNSPRGNSPRQSPEAPIALPASRPASPQPVPGNH